MNVWHDVLAIRKHLLQGGVQYRVRRAFWHSSTADARNPANSAPRRSQAILLPEHPLTSSREARRAVCSTALSSVWLMCLPANMSAIFPFRPARSARFRSSYAAEEGGVK